MNCATTPLGAVASAGLPSKLVVIWTFVQLINFYRVLGVSVGMSVVGPYSSPGPYICLDCDHITARLTAACRAQTAEGAPCAQYHLVQDRLCDRMCRATNKKACRQKLSVCGETPDCPTLCKAFYTELCPQFADQNDPIPTGDPCANLPVEQPNIWDQLPKSDILFPA